jgi:hypothetical protein
MARLSDSMVRPEEITDVERGLGTTTPGTTASRGALPLPPPRPDAVIGRASLRRLAHIAEIVFAQQRWRALGDIAYPSNPAFLEILTDVYQKAGLVAPLARVQDPAEPMPHYISAVLQPRLDQTIAAYRQDLAILVPVVEDEAVRFLAATAQQNRTLLDSIALDFLDPEALQSLNEAARSYQARLRRATHTVPSETAGFHNLEYARLERGVAGSVLDLRLRILFAQPERQQLVARIAVSPAVAEAVLREMFATAAVAITDFRDEIRSNGEDVWRYPSLLAGATALITHIDPELDTGESFLRFVLALGRARAGGAFGGLAFVAGTAVSAIALAWNPIGWMAAALLNC